MKYQSNRKEVKQAMAKANERMLEAVGKAGAGYVKAVTPVGQYSGGRVGGALRDSIEHKAEKESVLIGSTLMSEMYPIYVHKGTSRQKAQPYIHDGIKGNLNQLKKVAERNYKL